MFTNGLYSYGYYFDSIYIPSMALGKSLNFNDKYLTPVKKVNKPIESKETEEEAKRLLDYLGLLHRYDHKPGELSGGEQQRVAVARALINKPAVIFADEPSGNLDTHSAENLHQLFFKLRDEFGQTFVIVTHNEELANMADRKLVMVDGLISK